MLRRPSARRLQQQDAGAATGAAATGGADVDGGADGSEACAEVRAVLGALGADRIVVGHTHVGFLQSTVSD